ncbi:MarR family winged helix-turn-helix transcriptional regulator [Sulfitobacter sabulilitoris]|uniref:MarR family transcriptional regulator n=1 Tax=Sulfitobacter sabulilitoris TaxID=2562655 RepID=A0A5S3P7G6_9RHOB|nr:MarR family transcriptional regulator [Sulfitobacter sabulilitoris]TMM49301.1 MarR family transcriptional regulator [Sulfitobacter sabulilitoris]
MTNRIDPDSLGFLTGDLARLMRAAFEREIDRGAVPVTSAEARVLAHMARCGATRQNKLADRLGVAPMSLTGFLDKLEQAGLIARGTDPSDRRAKIVTLTPAADAVLEQIAQAGDRARTLARRDISDADWALFRDVALRLRGNLEQARRAAVPGRGVPA